MKRRALGRKIRFDVFKRDLFVCQYCGAKAPEVVLHVDHMKPIIEGGTNDPFNLITSCAGCNLGKGKRLLSENHTLDLQRAQLEELEERRRQLEMMLEWRDELRNFKSIEIDLIADRISKRTGYSLNQNGRAQLKDRRSY